MKNSLNNTLKELMSETFLKYNGCIIKMDKGKYWVHDTEEFDTLDAAKKRIDESIREFVLLIMKQNPKIIIHK